MELYKEIQKNCKIKLKLQKQKFQLNIFNYNIYYWFIYSFYYYINASLHLICY